jgi:alpha-N-arabinofuranosidase
MKKKITLVYPEKTGYIKPEVYGHFSEHIGGVIYDGIWVGKDSPIPNINGYRKDLVEKFKALNPPVLRWPGGCFAETYHWRDGIGKNRPVRPTWWTRFDGRYEPNEFGTHEFFEFCELIGAKAYLAVNVTSITPLEARDWIDYCLSPRGTTTLALEREANGRPEPFKIDFIGIGNENWGGGGNMTPEHYANVYRQFAKVIDNTTHCKIPLIIGGPNDSDYNWTRKITEGISTSKKKVSGMSIHYYTSATGDAVDFTDEEWYKMLSKAEKMEELINRHYATTLSYGLQNIMPLVIDEWGCWHPDGSGPSHGYNLFEQQSTMRDAMVSALTLNIFNNNADKILMANVAQLCNNLHALFLSGKEHLITTPTYHVFDMYKAHMGADAIRSLVSDNEGEIDKRISVSASKKDGKITLTAANYSLTEDVECEIDILGAAAPEKCSVTLLGANDVREHNTFDEPNTVTPTAYESSSASITIPHSSIVSVTFNIE